MEDDMFTKKLGFGLMRLPLTVPGVLNTVDMEQMKRMVDVFLERGFNYFDTAYVYGSSEECTKEALVKRHPRERYNLATKMPLSKLNASWHYGLLKRCCRNVRKKQIA
jgi:predicted aldo/keto reductase-like oxidoreductase